MQEERGARVGLGLILLAASVTLVVGLLAKSPCAQGNWQDGRQYRELCYSDIVALYGARGLADGDFPYLEADNEYPVGTGLLMGVTSWAAGSYGAFFYTNALVLSGLALASAVALYLMTGPRALMFAAAPTLAVYAFVNWDLLAVGLATFATFAFLSRRDLAAGVLLGLGAAAKLYPALLVIPFAAERIREREPDRGIHLAWTAAGTWIAVNLPFALASFGRWSEFFSLNTTRGADWDSLWFSACHRLFGSGFLSGQTFCEHTGVVNLLSPILFLGLVALVWWRKERRWPGFERWTLGFPVIVLFLLTNKVYSPQYSLWILPWFALALPSVRLWLAFAVTDVAVFVTRFAWFGRNAADRDPSFPAGWTDGFAVGFFELAVLVRAAVLVACLVAWVRREPERATDAEPEAEVVAEAR